MKIAKIVETSFKMKMITAAESLRSWLQKTFYYISQICKTEVGISLHLTSAMLSFIIFIIALVVCSCCSCKHDLLSFSNSVLNAKSYFIVFHWLDLNSVIGSFGLHVITFCVYYLRTLLIMFTTELCKENLTVLNQQIAEVHKVSLLLLKCFLSRPKNIC